MTQHICILHSCLTVEMHCSLEAAVDKGGPPVLRMTVVTLCEELPHWPLALQVLLLLVLLCDVSLMF